LVGVVQAQGENPNLGTIQGYVYEDVNGDGNCIDTGVAGENPIENVTVELVSSDGQTILNFTTGPDGRYGSYATGHSYWAVTAKPDATWVVTSAKTRYAPLDDDNRAVTGVNFCLQRGATGKVVALLPVSGAAWGMNGVTAVAFMGLGLFLFGFFLHLCRRSS
jgi:hypothetical protein